MVCSQFPIPADNTNPTNIFPKFTFDPNNYAFCEQVFGVKPDFDFATRNFGGKDPKHDYMSMTNVLLLNGGEDP